MVETNGRRNRSAHFQRSRARFHKRAGIDGSLINADTAKRERSRGVDNRSRVGAVLVDGESADGECSVNRAFAVERSRAECAAVRQIERAVAQFHRSESRVFAGVGALFQVQRSRDVNRLDAEFVRRRIARQSNGARGNSQQIDFRPARNRERAVARFCQIGVVSLARFFKRFRKRHRNILRDVHGGGACRIDDAERYILPCGKFGCFRFLVFHEIERAALEEKSRRGIIGRAERVSGVNRQRTAGEINAARHRVAHALGERHIAIENRQSGVCARIGVRQYRTCDSVGEPDGERAVQIKHHAGGANRRFRERNGAGFGEHHVVVFKKRCRSRGAGFVFKRPQIGRAYAPRADVFIPNERSRGSDVQRSVCRVVDQAQPTAPVGLRSRSEVDILGHIDAREIRRGKIDQRLRAGNGFAESFAQRNRVPGAHVEIAGRNRVAAQRERRAGNGEISENRRALRRAGIDVFAERQRRIRERGVARQRAAFERESAARHRDVPGKLCAGSD